MTDARSNSGQRRLLVARLAWWFVVPAVFFGQSTQGLIRGRVFDAAHTVGIAGAQVICLNIGTQESRAATSDRDGLYVLAQLTPGTYYCRAQARDTAPKTGYQPRESYEIQLPVASHVELDFPLRRADDVYDQDLYAAGFGAGSDAIVHVFAADARTTRAAPLQVLDGQISGREATISEVIDPDQLRELPLAGRDVYAMLITQPGITSDTTTGRSLGLSANGQQPSASNFLLDGLQRNDMLVSGPLSGLAPEAVQEYRISTTLYSAEYGGTSGYLANAVTRAGGPAWHGLAYFHLKNDLLNAADFQDNRNGIHTPVKESNPGVYLGGPLVRDRLFAAGSWDGVWFRSRGEPVKKTVLTPAFHPDPGTAAEQILRLYPVPAVAASSPTATLMLAPPFPIDDYQALARIDYPPARRGHRLLARMVATGEDRPDFLWTPYTQFSMPLSQKSISTAAAWDYTRPGGFTQELRAGWTAHDLRFDRPHPEVPTLESSDQTLLPGSPAFYSFLNRDRDLELGDSIGWITGRHLLRVGGGLLLHHLDGYLTAGRDRKYIFNNVADFAQDRTYEVQVGVSRALLPATGTSFLSPDYNRSYRQIEFSLFAQDSYRVTPRLTINYGVRYESPGVPRNTGQVQNARLLLGNGATFVDRLLAAHVDYPRGSGLSLYDADNRDWAGRVGLSWSIAPDGRTVLRAGAGIFYDRPFDNLWANLRNNAVALSAALYPPSVTRYLASGVTTPVSVTLGDDTSSRLLLYQPGIRTPHVQNFLIGVQQQVAPGLTVALNGFGSLGRRLITNDVLNRFYSSSMAGPLQFFRTDLGPILYRANQGSSNDTALAATTQWKTMAGTVHLSWTWSHAIDNQSDPLAGDYLNLDSVGIIPQQKKVAAAFTRQFDSRVDRGNSDFDQRHNVVVYSIWRLPEAWQRVRWLAVLRHWRVSELAAFRTGEPFTVYGASLPPFFANRAKIVDPRAMASDAATTGGRILLNAAAFDLPDFGTIGNSGRNAFRAPGYYNVDLSLARTLAFHALGEGGRIVLRADLFNALNHANLGTPNSIAKSTSFGLATYGRQGVTTGFPAAVPFQETARQVQLMLHVEF
jgi:hypothetical protein